MATDETHRNAFIGKTGVPDDTAIAAALGSAKDVWDELIASHAAEHGVSISEWRSYSAKSGWALRLKRGKRTIVWLSPCAGGCFLVSLVLGGKAMQAARECGLSVKGLKALDAAERYPEGNGIRLIVKSARDLGTVKKLIPVKIAN